MSATLLLDRLPSATELRAISAHAASLVARWRLEKNAFFAHCWTHYLMPHVGDKLCRAGSLFGAGYGPSEICVRLEDVLSNLALHYLQENRHLRADLLAYITGRIMIMEGLVCAVAGEKYQEYIRVTWRTS